MKHFILENEPDADGSVRLTGKDYNYLVNVRRLKAGGTLDCLLPSGEIARLRIVRAERGILHAECVPASPLAGSEGGLAPITLFQAMPTGAKMDTVVRMAGEAGVSEIAPFYSARSVPRNTYGAIEARLDRWRRVLKEARQQSGSRAIGTVRAPVGLDGFLSYWESVRQPEALGLIALPLAKNGFHLYLETMPKMIALAVGPEGGFAPEEENMFTGAGFRPVSLGPTVLRTEHAALYAVAAIRTLLVERNSWTLKTRR
jgi:16S rRNA (uracil1498-N3)-methyltransferase